MTYSQTSQFFHRNAKVKFSDSDKQYMMSHYKIQNAREISEALGRSQASVRSFLLARGLSPVRIKAERWSKADIEFLVRHFEDTDANEIAIYVGRSVSSVCVKAHKLGLRKSRELIYESYHRAAMKRLAKFGSAHKRGQGCKQVICLDNDGNLLGVYPSVKDAAAAHEVPYCVISKTCHSVSHWSFRLKGKKFWFLKHYNATFNTNIKCK